MLWVQLQRQGQQFKLQRLLLRYWSVYQLRSSYYQRRGIHKWCDFVVGSERRTDHFSTERRTNHRSA